jgi:hypothetical protein
MWSAMLISLRDFGLRTIQGAEKGGIVEVHHD